MTINKNIGARVASAASPALQKKIFVYSAALLGLLIASYLYMVGSITFDVVARKSAESDLRTVRASVGELELEYLSLNNTIDMAYAKDLGFKEASDAHFATRGSFASRLTLGR